MSSLDYLDLCRLCLVKDRVSVPIFGGEGNDLFLKIAACLPVKVGREDKLPKKICDDCVYKVELFYEFWNTTANAEKRLLQWLGEVNVESGKQGYVPNVLNPNVMKQEQSTENRLDGSVMQQVGEHQNNMGMSMMDNMGLGIPMMIPNTNQQQQITSVPMDTSGSPAQNVQAVPGPSSQTTHNQISQNQTSSTQQEDEEESSEDDENSDDECDGDEGLPVKEESEEDPNSRTIEPTTFVNVSLACDEAGPSGLQQQKITDMPEMPISQSADGDPKTGMSTTAARLNPRQPLFVDCKGESSFECHPEGSIRIKSPPISDDDESDNDNFIRIESCYSMSTEVHDDRSDHDESNGMTIEIGNDSAMNPIKEDPDASAVSSILTPDVFSETRTIQNVKLPIQDDVEMNVIKRVLVPMHTLDGSKCFQVKEVIVPTQRQSSLHAKGGPQAPNRSTKSPCPAKTRKILPKLMPILTVRDGDGVDAEEQTLESAEDPLKEKKLVGDDLDAMDKMLDDLRNTCPACSMRFNSAQQMGRHFRQRHENQFPCKSCHYRCSTSEDLANHARTHEQDTYLQCDLCERKYKRIGGLMAHRVQKHSTVDPKSMRDVLPRQRVPAFDREDPENTWGRRKLLGRTYACQRCKSVYLRKSFLIAHERIAHGIGADAEPYRCDVCNKSFKNSHLLRKHNKSHNAKFLCALCGRELRSLVALQQHTMRHNGEKPYECKACGKCFTTKVTRKVHELTHSGLRPYICDICGQSFTQRSSMMVHRKKHPGDRPPPPPVNLKNIKTVGD
ncbi:uncharacterized protein LOC117224805 isoform X4 [Megalopta genalis]|uniref:uncharacterized protein LOC117224805 isoform X4 n=1 Tax=Megalopta genalis TaxID=115081 RepID=UPI003FD4FE34